MKYTFFPFLLFALFLFSCIGDDIIFDEVPENVRITNPLDTLGIGESFQFQAAFTNNVGREEEQDIQWASSDPTLLSINENGLATALEKGLVQIIASVELEGKPPVADTNTIVIDEETVLSMGMKSGTIKTTSSYQLEGSFTVVENDGNLLIQVGDDYKASTALPGLYVYLGNNPATISGAFEIGRVEVFSGGHAYEVEGVGLNDYQYLLYWCKPFNVKVGEGIIE